MEESDQQPLKNNTPSEPDQAMTANQTQNYENLVRTHINLRSPHDGLKDSVTANRRKVTPQNQAVKTIHPTVAQTNGSDLRAARNRTILPQPISPAA